MTDTLWLFYPAAANETDPHVVTGCYKTTSGWSAEQAVGGFVDGDVTAIPVPTATGFLQLFYAGASAPISVRSISQNATGWSEEQDLGGSPSSDITAIQVPGTQQLQLFYVGTDDSNVYTLEQEADGTWPAQPTNLGGTAGGNITAIQVPGTRQLQLFYAGTNAHVYTLKQEANGSWPTTPTQIGGNTQIDGDVTAIPVPGTDLIQLFFAAIQYTWVDTLVQEPGGTWPAAPTKIGGNPQSGDITAIQVPGTGLTQLFYMGPGQPISTPGGPLPTQGVCSLKQQPDGSWSAEQNLGGGPYSDITVIQVAGTQQLQLFYVGFDADATAGGDVFTLVQDASGTWPTDWTQIVGTTAVPPYPISTAFGVMPPGPCALLLADLQQAIQHPGFKITTKEGEVIAQDLRTCYARGSLTKQQYEWGVWALNTINKLPITPPTPPVPIG
jgi:hypothetical protein